MSPLPRRLAASVRRQLQTRQRELEADAAKKTKTARQAQQQRKQHVKAKKEKSEDLPIVSNQLPSTGPVVLKGYDPGKVQPIDDDY